MERVFTELSPRRDEIACLYAVGHEKKEIASRLFRSVATVNTTLQSVFSILQVRNRSELSIRFSERVTGYDIKRAVVAVFLLFIFSADMTFCGSGFIRTRRTEERAEARREDDLYNPFA